MSYGMFIAAAVCLIAAIQERKDPMRLIGFIVVAGVFAFVGYSLIGFKLGRL